MTFIEINAALINDYRISSRGRITEIYASEKQLGATVIDYELADFLGGFTQSFTADSVDKMKALILAHIQYREKLNKNN